MEDTEAHQAPVQKLADKVAAWLIPVVLVFLVGVWLVTRDVFDLTARDHQDYWVRDAGSKQGVHATPFILWGKIDLRRHASPVISRP